MKGRDIFLAALLLGLLAVLALGAGRRSCRSVCCAAAEQTLSAGRDTERQVETAPDLFALPPTVCVPAAKTLSCGWRASGNGPQSGSAVRRAFGAMRPSAHNIALLKLLKGTTSPHANRDYHVYRLRRIVI